MPRKSFKPVQFRNTQILELIHSDVCDSNRGFIRGGSRYFITFIADHSKFCYTFLMKTKDEVLRKFEIFKTEVENQQENKIKILRSDWGGEYTSNEFALFCEKYEIMHEATISYSPQSNGVAERKNRTLLYMINAMIISLGISQNLWVGGGGALLSACYILNIISIKNNNKTPYEL